MLGFTKPVWSHDKFRARNLTDTQWVTRLLADELKRMFPSRAEMRAHDGREEHRVFTRPGAITAKLRRAWGLESLKKDFEFYKDQGYLEGKPTTVDQVVDTSFAEAAVKQLGKYQAPK